MCPPRQRQSVTMLTQTLLALLALFLLVHTRGALACTSGGEPAGTRPPPGVTPGPQTPTDQVTEGLRGAVGGNIAASPYESGATGDPITRDSDLSCTFDGLCRWYNGQNDQLDYNLGTGRGDPEKWRQATGTSEQPQEPFAVIASQTRDGNDNGQFVSDPIVCQQGSGTLSFRYWLTPNVQLRACYRFLGDSTYQFCSDPLPRTSSPGPASVRIPGPINDPFELVLETKNFVFSPGGFAMVDNIQYQAEVSNCNGPPITTTTRAGATTTTGRPGATNPPGPTPLAACQALKCAFSADFCSYRPQPEQGQGFGEWQIAQTPVSNPLTGVPTRPGGAKGERIAVSQFPDTSRTGPKPSLRQVLTSPEVDLQDSQTLEFNRYQATAGTELRVCVNKVTDQDCIWVSPPLSRGTQENIDLNRRWRKETVRIPPGKYNLLFVSQYDKSQQFNTGATGLAGVQLIDARRQQPLC